ncbi:MAG: alpha/beta fold hydrolase [Myxococcaceae bacterium]|nr:alpha/beta fold hydrolase [Myxococcaceae bacterium]
MSPPAAAREGGAHPTVDDVEFRALYKKTKYVVETADGWSLVITRYRPTPQLFPQPLFGEPMLLVHGFCQNRHAWTSGEFVKNLLFFGIDVHILELRGHGKSSIELQRERAAKFGSKLPSDLSWDWDIDSYFLYDLPAAVAGVRRITRRDRIFYCGHSMGGMLGYGYAGIHQEHFEGIITIGAPAEVGKGSFALQWLAYAGPGISSMVDAALGGLNLQRGIGHTLSQLASKITRKDAGPQPRTLKYRYLPLDAWLKAASDALGYAEQSPLAGLIASRVTWLTNWDRMSMSDVRWLLKEGGEKEPRKVVDQFFKWIRGMEVVCYRTGYDFQRGFAKIKVPMAIIFGDQDPLASLASTRSVYRAAKSEYLLWRPVKGNSHIELTMGHDIRQICYDIKNLIEYARTHRARSPSLPRVND